MTKHATRSNLNEISTLANWVRTITGQSGLRARFVDAPGPYTDGDTIYIPSFSARMTEDDITKIRWWVLHECLHHTEGERVFQIAKDNNLTQGHELGNIFNILEDVRIERAGAKKYRGDKEVISAGRDLFLSKYPERFREMQAEDPEGKNDALNHLVATMVAAKSADVDWCWSSTKNIRGMVDNMPDGAKRALKNITDQFDVVKEIAELADEEASWNLTKRIYDAMGGDSKEELEKLKAEAKARGKGEGEGQGKGKGQSGEGEGKDKAEAEDKAKGFFKDLLPHDHAANERTPNRDLELDYSQFKGTGNWAPLDVDKIKVVNYSKGETVSMKDYGYSRFKDALRSCGHTGSEVAVQALANRVKRLLTVKSQAYYTGGYKHGRIHNKNLWKVGMPLVGDGDWNSKVFKRKYLDDVLDTAVTICIDFSGSMSGDKVGHAGIAALMLNECISRSLRVPVEVMTYTSQGGQYYPLLGLVKYHDERVTYDMIVDRLNDASSQMSENPDADSLLWAWNRLRARKEKRKVMIVLSDGQPTAAFQASGLRGGDPVRALKDTVEMIQGERNTSIYGIGITHMGVKDIFKKHVIIQRAEDLESTILNLLDKEFINK